MKPRKDYDDYYGDIYPSILKNQSSYGKKLLSNLRWLYPDFWHRRYHRNNNPNSAKN
ncbi:MAG: hypothetical protein MRK02_00955 [Candidatus Scalindua sp.]|nr:hypothetical protein [Candidatus Scalindua sp.]